MDRAHVHGCDESFRHTVEFHPNNSNFHNHYGDRKDLGLLARQMFKIAGIDANMCLFSGEFNGNPQHSLLILRLLIT